MPPLSSSVHDGSWVSDPPPHTPPHRPPTDKKFFSLPHETKCTLFAPVRSVWFHLNSPSWPPKTWNEYYQILPSVLLLSSFYFKVPLNHIWNLWSYCQVANVSSQGCSQPKWQFHFGKPLCRLISIHSSREEGVPRICSWNRSVGGGWGVKHWAVTRSHAQTHSTQTVSTLHRPNICTVRTWAVSVLFPDSKDGDSGD